MNKRQRKKKASLVFSWTRTKSGQKISSIEFHLDLFYPIWVRLEGLGGIYTFTKEGYYIDKSTPSSLDLVR